MTSEAGHIRTRHDRDGLTIELSGHVDSTLRDQAHGAMVELLRHAGAITVDITAATALSRGGLAFIDAVVEQAQGPVLLRNGTRRVAGADAVVSPLGVLSARVTAEMSLT